MKRPLIFLLFTLFIVSTIPTSAQTRQGHMSTSERVKKNKKSSRWAKRRIKASKGDMTNIKCSPRQTRKSARRTRR